MAKRFTDTEKWKKPFIRGLDAPHKLLWLYICDDCDNAGIWQVDIDVASIRIGESININDALAAFGDKVIPICGGEKWFIPSFIEFQYPSGLNPANNAHAGVIKILKRYNLNISQNEPLMSPSPGALDMDMDMDKDKDKEKKPKKQKKYVADDPPTLEEFKAFFVEKGYRPEIAERAYNGYSLNNWKDAKDAPIVNWRAKVNNSWFRDEHRILVSIPSSAPTLPPNVISEAPKPRKEMRQVMNPSTRRMEFVEVES